MFSGLSRKTLTRAALFKDAPVYVQFYITARCNLTCAQCNIIYTNADVRECTLEEIHQIADNFAKMGVAIVLLTGGEPFARKDLPEIVRAFESRGVHVRMQTNGYASEEQIAGVVAAGGRDISISLDSLDPQTQAEINGGFDRSWHQALKAMALFTKYLPKKDSFASIGCVLAPRNASDAEDVIRFGSKISWYSSLVPAHVSDQAHPKGFRSFDPALRFLPDEFPAIDSLIERIRQMRKEGYLLYDSDQYLDDIKRFIRGEAVTWRDRNAGVCDSPNLYFALLPNGEFAPCCDHRLSRGYAAYNKDFPRVYLNRSFRDEVFKTAKACGGCLYGSYPEITISMRFMAAALQRARTFFASPAPKKWPISYEELLGIAENIRNETGKRRRLRQPRTISVLEADGA